MYIAYNEAEKKFSAGPDGQENTQPVGLISSFFLSFKTIIQGELITCDFLSLKLLKNGKIQCEDICPAGGTKN